MVDYRASFDATIRFSNGGDEIFAEPHQGTLRVEGLGTSPVRGFARIPG